MPSRAFMVFNEINTRIALQQQQSLNALAGIYGF